MNSALSLKEQLKTTTNGWVEWLDTESKGRMSFASDLTSDYIDRYCDLLDGEWEYLRDYRHIVVPKYEAFSLARYSTAGRKILNRLITPAKAHCRCHRSTGARLKQVLLGQSAFWDFTIKQDGIPEELTRGRKVKPVTEAAAEEDLYNVLEPRYKTRRALRIIGERQPGWFMIIPCKYGEVREQNADTVFNNVVGDDFGLTVQIVLSDIIQNIDELHVTDSHGPWGCGGEAYARIAGKIRRKKNSDIEDFLKVTLRSSVRCECLPSTGIETFSEAIGTIPRELPK